MLYDFLKIIHIISACFLFGTGLGTAFYMFYVNLQKDIHLIARATRQVVFADWIFTGTSGLIQPITGFALVVVKGYSLTSIWVFGSILGYVIAGVCWAPVVWLQLRCAQISEQCVQSKEPLTKQYYQYFRIWVVLGIPAFAALIMVFYLMTVGPLSGSTLFGIHLNMKIF